MKKASGNRLQPSGNNDRTEDQIIDNLALASFCPRAADNAVELAPPDEKLTAET
jgi:hypothetical protein